MKRNHLLSIGLVAALCGGIAKAGVNFTDTFENYGTGALGTGNGWTINNGSPASTGVWNVITPSTGNKSIEFYNLGYAFSSAPQLTRTLELAVSGNWNLSFNYGFRYGFGTSAGNYVGAGSVMSGVDLLDASGTGYRIVLRQGNSGSLMGSGANAILIYSVSNNVVGAQIGAMAGFCAPGWAQTTAGGVGYAQWRSLSVDWSNGALILKTDANLDGTPETPTTLANQSTTWQLSSISLLSLSTTNTHSADFDNITFSVPEAASVGLLGIGALALLKNHR